MTASLIVIPLFAIAGCSGKSVPTPTVHSVNYTVTIPKQSNIKSIQIISDGAAQMYMVPKHSSEVETKVLNWLSHSAALSVKLPQFDFTTHPWVTSGYGGPASLHFNLRNGSHIAIAPASYVWLVPHSNDNFKYYYVDNVIELKDGVDTPHFLRSPSLYKWLKQDEWRSEFTYETSTP